MMTKKDYVRAAALIVELRASSGKQKARQALATLEVYNKIEEVFVTFFEVDNPRFDRERFLAACRKVD